MAWQTEHVLTEMRRRYPEPLSGDELQQVTGMGAEDLRVALDEMREQVWLDERGTGFVLTAAGYDAETAEGDPDTAPAPAPTSVDTAGFYPAGEGVTASGGGVPTRYEAKYTVTVGYFPEPEAEESEDTAAIREAVEIRDKIRDLVYAAFPGLPVTIQSRVDAFDAPRQVA